MDVTNINIFRERERRQGKRCPYALAAVCIDDLVDGSIELDRVHDVHALNLPRVAVDQPVVRKLDLIAILDLLVEHPVRVPAPLVSCIWEGKAEKKVSPEAVAPGRVVVAREAVHEARRQAAQPAIAQTRVAFLQ